MLVYHSALTVFLFWSGVEVTWPDLAKKTAIFWLEVLLDILNFTDLCQESSCYAIYGRVVVTRINTSCSVFSSLVCFGSFFRTLAVNSVSDFFIFFFKNRMIFAGQTAIVVPALGMLCLSCSAACCVLWERTCCTGCQWETVRVLFLSDCGWCVVAAPEGAAATNVSAGG